MRKFLALTALAALAACSQGSPQLDGTVSTPYGTVSAAGKTITVTPTSAPLTLKVPGGVVTVAPALTPAP